MLSTGRDLCVREWSELLKTISTQSCFSLKGGKVKKMLGIIAMQRDEADNDPLCVQKVLYCIGTVFLMHPSLKPWERRCCMQNVSGSHLAIQSVCAAWLLCQLQLLHLLKQPPLLRSSPLQAQLFHAVLGTTCPPTRWRVSHIPTGIPHHSSE